MVRKQKKGENEHFCVLIYAQGQWSESDRESVEEPIKDVVRTYTPEPYPFFLKLTRRLEPFSPGDCKLCTPVYDFLQELKGQSNGTLYLGHHYIIPEDDLEDMTRFVKMVLDNEKVKKMFMLFLDGFGEVKRTELALWDIETLKSQITTRSLRRDDFLTEIDSGKFDNRTLYEIIKW